MKRTLFLALVIAAIGGCGQGPDLVHDSLPPAPTVVEASGLYPVSVGDKMGYMDATGKLVIEPKWDMADEFREGLAVVSTGSTYVEGRLRFDTMVIDETGKAVIQKIILPDIGGEDYFSEGLIAYQDGEKTGYKDRTGKVVIPAKFYCESGEGDCGCACEDGAAQPFKNGMAWVMEGHKTYLIDKTGKRLPADAEELANSGLARFTKGKLDGFKDSSGRVVIAPTFHSAGKFSEGLCAVKLGEADGYMFIDKTGKQAFLGTFDYVNPFSEGVAVVKQRDQYCVVDRMGTIYPIEGNPETHGSFTNGLIKGVAIDGTMNWSDHQEVLINKKGKIVARFKKSDHKKNLFGQRIESDYDGHLVQIYSQDKDGVSGWADRTGKMIWIDKPRRD